MTPRERVLTALAVGQPDRVPFMEAGVDREMQVQIMGREDHTPVELAAKLGLDGVTVDFLPPLFAETSRTATREFVARPLLAAADASLDMMHFPDVHAPGFLDEAKRLVDMSAGVYAVAARIRLGLSPTHMSMGLESFSYALHDRPDFVAAVLERYGDWTIQVLQQLADVGVDLIWSFDDMAFKTGTMFSPRVFHELFLPRLQRVADAIHATGLPWIFHSDGNLMPVVDDLLTLDMNALHPIEPGAMDINEMKRRYGQRLCLVGNIDLHYTLTQGTPQEVEAEVRDRIQQVGRGGGYIISSANTITSYCKLENVLAMRDAIQRCGWYDSAAGADTDGV